MKFKVAFPPLQECIFAISIIVIFSILTAVFVGFRPEHLLLIFLFSALFFLNKESRKLAAALLPFLIFGISYDWMRVFPNYMVNPIDVESLYNIEKSVFGIMSDGLKLIPCEYFAVHQHPVVDFFSGIFYLGWVPIPLGFGIYLYLKKEKEIFLRFALVFLFTNLFGFACYYIHPAAPPWYAMQYGFDPVVNTPGNMAGLSRFDELINYPLFASLYGRNSNVFAAFPSLHSAYLVVTLFYAVKKKSPTVLIAVITLFMFGIWATAVYTAHHYVIDVLAGIACAGIGILGFEYGLMKFPFFRRFFNKYLNYIV
jgi:hypothetical protein